ncbi:MAG TPA: TrkH family potassium uptake protein [Elusimicrobiota bacterium]|nr:TrkH family potassium uptake protein [Elusimicrobiota bacterium]
MGENPSIPGRQRLSFRQRISRLSATQVLNLLFFSLIALGTGLLSLPWATQNRHPLSFWDALFTSTSAVCVTGLAAFDIGTRLSLFGQLVLLALIQLGGLGYMTLASLIAVILGKISLKDRLVFQEASEQFSFDNLTAFAKRVIKLTIFLEALGGLALFIAWRGRFPVLQTVYYSLFHSISAFCNAGFSLFSQSLIRDQANLTVNITIISLIVLGGLGFIVLSDLVNYIRHRTRVSTHSRIVLFTTAGLIVGGFLALFLLEFRNPATLRDLAWPAKGLICLFQSVTPRTAGFNTIPLENMTLISVMVVIFLMFIGASPGGTGGGIKTTTFAIITSTLWSTLKGRQDVNLFGRRVSLDAIRKSFALATMAFISVILVVFLVILFNDRFSLIQMLFEVVSAFGTVGLSLGITPQLNAPQKVSLAVLMFLGRVGPLVVGMAVLRQSILPYRYAEEKILVG